MNPEERPYVLLSAATSIDGHIDDATGDRLILSGPDDLDRVDDVRAGVDAILVGAATVRADDPRLLVRSERRRSERRRRGLPDTPAKVTVTANGDIPADAAFFTAGDAERLVYAADPVAPALRDRLGDTAVVIAAGDPPALPDVLADLRRRGVRRLMVEGGGAVHTAFLTAGLFDELHLVVAPFFVGDPDAPRFASPGRYRNDRSRPLRLVECRDVGGVALLRLVAD